MATATLSPPDTFVPPVKLAAAKTFVGSIKLAQRAIVVRVERMRFDSIKENNEIILFILP
jgi:hypothetical protein